MSSSGDEEDDTGKAGRAFLRSLRLWDIFDVFRRTDWHQSESILFEIHEHLFELIEAREEDRLETFVDRLYNARYPGRRMSYREIISMLVRRDYISTSHFLETVVRKAGAEDLEMLNWLCCGFKLREFGARALGTAAYLNNFRAVDWLLDEGVDINGTVSSPHPHPKCRCQISVLDYARLPRLDGEEPGASDEMIAYLRGQGAKSTGLNIGLLGLLRCALRQDYFGQSFFSSKVQSIVQRIHGFADIACQTESVLECCILWSEYEGFHTNDRPRVFEYLLDQGARTSDGSPLAALIYMDCRLTLIDKLLAKTADINAYCNAVSLNNTFERFPGRPPSYGMVQSMSPIQAAASRCRKEVIHILLQNGADVNCPARNSGGVTPLQAVISLHPDLGLPGTVAKLRVIQLLLQHGANINAAPAWTFGFTALQAAAFVGNVQVANFLISQGADVNAPACKYGGGTALSLAARERHTGMVELLLKAGAAVPADGVLTPSFGAEYGDRWQISCLPISTELAAYRGNGTPSRDWHEYEAEWADDPTYNKE